MPGTQFSLEVRPEIPEALRPLEALADNLYYSWDRQVRELFVRLDPELWNNVGHNPKLLLRRVAQKRLDAAAADRQYLQDLNRVHSAWEVYLQRDKQPETEELVNSKEDLIAYFCAEFGFHESLPIYSGGLGILAGDHCKAASDMGLPFVGVGMLYRQGYFSQEIGGHGNQIAHFRNNDFTELPLYPAKGGNGGDLKVEVSIADRKVQVGVWVLHVGTIRIYLLDTDLPENSEADRRITYQLYGGDISTRIQQEIVLGIGGVRALRALGYQPTIWHINEGHAAFQILERCREAVQEEGLDFASALELVAGATVFTTHTPVPAGHDRFSRELMETYFEAFPKALGIDFDTFMGLGNNGEEDEEGLFNQTSLAIRGSRFQNGVSRIHGGVASKMETRLWPEVPAHENPIGHVTNGVHVFTFLAQEWSALFDLRFGTRWRSCLRDPEFWKGVAQIPDQNYWGTRQVLKAELFERALHRADRQHRRNGCSEHHIQRLTHQLSLKNTDILTIGFARRFATYKRAALLFRDSERLARLLKDPQRPVLLMFAGKAHPNDEPGQELLKRIHEFSMQPEFEGHVFLLEDYDLALARKLLAGVDVWLNTPEYPMEASGTSGQKAALNGVINLSVRDGWWGEGYDGENGWVIPPIDTDDPEERDREDGNELLDLLERKVIPLYYSRNGQGYSEGWVAKSKASMSSILPRFNAERMVMDYISHYYAPAIREGRRLGADNAKIARSLATWKERVAAAWPEVRIRRTDPIPSAIRVGEQLELEVAANLAGLAAEDVRVECLLGTREERCGFVVHETHELTPQDTAEGGETLYRAHIESGIPGLQYYQIRAYPYHPELTHRFETGRMIWI